MIISKFNKYVEKHGRTTYIILGVIICFAFVIFVTPNQNSGGCGGSRRLTSLGEMYGRKIKVEQFMAARARTDVNSIVNSGYALSQLNEQYLNQQTLNRMIMVQEAKKGGFYGKVTDEQMAETIRNFTIFKNDKNEFDPSRFENFKNGFLRNSGMTASDFDDMVRENLAITAMMDSVRAKVTVSDADVDSEMAEYGVSYANLSLDLDGDTAPAQAEIDDFFAKRKSEIIPEKQRAAVVAVFAPSSIEASLTNVTSAEIQKQFENGKNGLYAGKKLEQVKAEIAASLKENKARAQARARADKLAKDVAAAAAKTPEQALAAFRKLAGSAKATVKEIGLFTVGDRLPGLDGEHYMLADAIRGLNKKGETTQVVIDGSDSYSVAMLSDVKDGIVPDKLNGEYTDRIKEKLIEEKALAFYKESIAPYKAAAANSSDIWSVVMPAAMEIQNAKNMSIAERQEKLKALEDKVREQIQPFYVSEERSFDYVVFPYSDYEKQVKVTDEQLKKEYEEHKAELEKQGKKTFEAAKAGLVSELTSVGARKLAQEQAEKLSEALGAAWDSGAHEAARQASVFGMTAGNAKAKVQSVPLGAQYNYFAQGAAGDQVLMTAVFKTTLDKPFTGAVAGTNGAYVASTKEVKPAYLEDGAARLPLLVNVYSRTVSDAKTRSRAEALVEKLNGGDEAAVKSTAFKAAESKLSRKNLAEFREFYARDMEALFKALKGAKEKQVLAPSRTYSGYVLVRLDSRIVPSGEAVKEEREKTRKSLKDTREQEALSEFYEQAMARADVKNLHSIITGKRD